MLRHRPGRRPAATARSRPLRVPTAMAVATLTAALLGGCSLLPFGGSEPTAQEQPAQRVVESDSAPADARADEHDDASDEASPGGLDPADAIATVSTQADGGSLDIHVMEAEVVGKLLRVRLWYQPGPDYGPQEYNVYELGGSTQEPAPYLLDPANLLKYSVVMADGYLQTDGIYVEGSAEQPLVMTHYFAAPPGDVKNLQLAFENVTWPTVELELR